MQPFTKPVMDYKPEPTADPDPKPKTIADSDQVWELAPMSIPEGVLVNF